MFALNSETGDPLWFAADPVSFVAASPTRVYAMQFKYDWNKKQWTQLPLGIELDYVTDFWGQKINWFINPQYNFVTTDSSSGWTIFVGLTLLVPGA